MIDAAIPLDHLDRDQLFAVIVNASARLNALANKNVATEPAAVAVASRPPAAAPVAAAASHLTMRAVCLRLSISAATLWRLRKSGGFPKPINVTGNRPRWRESDIASWEKRRTA